MRAYKWLDVGGKDPLEEFAWPSPQGEGPWVRMATRLKREPRTLANPDEHLPVDIAAELWEIELEAAQSHGVFLRAKRGRLVRRIESWTEETASSFGSECTRRVDRFRTEAIEVAQRLLEDVDVSALIQEDQSRDFFERFRQPSPLESRAGPRPPATVDGFGMALSGMMGNPRRMERLQEEVFDSYAVAHPKSGAFWSALEAADRLWRLEQLGEAEDSPFSGPFGQARLASEAAQSGAQNLAMARRFAEFERGLMAGEWTRTLRSAWKNEVRWQRDALLDALGPSGRLSAPA